jgi:hypothetical protein
MGMGCAWHWPGSTEKSRRPFTLGHERETLSPLEVGLNAAGALGLTLVLHEAGHALIASLSDADDVKISFFSGGRIGSTSFEGDLSQGELNAIHLAGVGTTYLTGELLEWALAKDAVPNGLRPFTASLALASKSDFYLQTVQAFARDGSDFDDLADEADWPKAAFVGAAVTDLWFHQDTYIDLIREATTVRKAVTPEQEPP